MKLSNMKDVQNISQAAKLISERLGNYTRCKKDARQGRITISATDKSGHQRKLVSNKSDDNEQVLAFDDTELELLDWIVMRAKDRHEAELNAQLESLGVDSKINLLTGEIEDVCDD